MYLLNLGKLSGQQSMLVFHALARMGYEGLIVVSPKIPLVSIGYFQDASAEVDLDYCRVHNLPFMRREVGGGATYLDENQVFYQVVWNKDNPKFPQRIKEIFRYLSQPACEVYKEFGIEAYFREENDIITKQGKKIAGEGGGNIQDSMVFVGGILMDFDYKTMVRVLKVPGEKFRDKIYKTMGENLTTMKRELGEVPNRDEVVKVVIDRFQRLLGPLKKVELDREAVDKMIELEKWFASPEFLHKKTPKIPKGVKIKEGIEILYGMYKAKGGLIRNVQEVEEKRIKDIGVSGDFNFFPKEGLDSLEKRLKDVERKEKELKLRIEEFYDKEKPEIPGVSPDDFTTSILTAEKR